MNLKILSYQVHKILSSTKKNFFKKFEAISMSNENCVT